MIAEENMVLFFSTADNSKPAVFLLFHGIHLSGRSQIRTIPGYPGARRSGQ